MDKKPNQELRATDTLVLKSVDALRDLADFKFIRKRLAKTAFSIQNMERSQGAADLDALRPTHEDIFVLQIVHDFFDSLSELKCYE